MLFDEELVNPLEEGTPTPEVGETETTPDTPTETVPELPSETPTDKTPDETPEEEPEVKEPAESPRIYTSDELQEKLGDEFLETGDYLSNIGGKSFVNKWQARVSEGTEFTEDDFTAVTDEWLDKYKGLYGDAPELQPPRHLVYEMLKSNLTQARTVYTEEQALLEKYSGVTLTDSKEILSLLKGLGEHSSTFMDFVTSDYHKSDELFEVLSNFKGKEDQPRIAELLKDAREKFNKAESLLKTAINTANAEDKERITFLQDMKGLLKNHVSEKKLSEAKDPYELWSKVLPTLSKDVRRKVYSLPSYNLKFTQPKNTKD